MKQFINRDEYIFNICDKEQKGANRDFYIQDLIDRGAVKLLE